MPMRCPESIRIIASTPVVELENNKMLIVTFSVSQNEDRLWQIAPRSSTRHISPRIPTALKHIKARLMIINAGHNKKTDQLSVVFFTPYGHAVYPVLDLNSIEQTDQELYVYIEADRNNIKVYCVKENYYKGLFLSFPCVISEIHLTARKIIEDIRSN